MTCLNQTFEQFTDGFHKGNNLYLQLLTQTSHGNRQLFQTVSTDERKCACMQQAK